ncbi:MAG: RidA family protein [Saprospirales bacterium]|nr:RidA family protein [Saprospirales bacterium]MBK6901830.1 RidA family protein [Saprospirales bacterium]MBK7336419.1 RidA family protein [Saprospirales bacterium]
MTERKLITTGDPWEPVVGYSRAIRVGSVVEVAGTTAVKDGHVVAKGDPYAQTRFILEKIKGALEAAGAKMEDVTRTRIFVTDISHWQQVGKAHGEFFRDIRPASTMVEVKGLINPDMLVEIEATAVLEP